MRLEDLTTKHLVEIVRLYELHCGRRREFRDAMYEEPSSVLAHLKRNGGEEYRIGSRWDGHSKLYFETDFHGNITVRFNSNFDPNARNGKSFEEAEKFGSMFVKAAMQYLDSQNP
ncbi:MAG: hypothetical protein ACP5NW_00410 [Candidatus Woesearchaeota archaeon]